MCQPCTFDFGSLCSDVGGVLKTCFCDLPKVVKSFYLSCSCGPSCLEPKLELILSAYGIHFYIYWISFIVSCALWGVSGTLAVNLGTPLFNAIVTLLTLFWAVIVCKQPQQFCLTHPINLVLWTILMCWLLIGAIVIVIGGIGLIGFYPPLAVQVVLYLLDLLIIIPLTVWSITTTIGICKKNALGGGSAGAVNPAPAPPAPPVARPAAAPPVARPAAAPPVAVPRATPAPPVAVPVAAPPVVQGVPVK